MNRFGFIHLPGAILKYAAELDLTIEDIGVLTIILYTYQKSTPLADIGISAGQILSVCPFCSGQKLSRCLNRLSKLGLIELDGDQRKLAERTILVEPLFGRISELIQRDHTALARAANAHKQKEQLLINKYEQEIEELKAALAAKTSSEAITPQKTSPALKVADFIAAKQGRLLSSKMQRELEIWLNDWQLSPEFLVMVIEMSFENEITSPQELSYIISELKDTNITGLDGLQLFFEHYSKKKAKRPPVTREIAYEMLELGKFTGIDMSAEARRDIYYKWRFDWGFSHELIMKAGALMSQRVQRGGLEYMDSILLNWKNKNIFTLDAVEKELIEFKNRQRQATNTGKPDDKISAVTVAEYDIYIPKDELKKLKTTSD